MSEKPKCNAAIRTEIKVRSSCMCLFTTERQLMLSIFIKIALNSI